jgi:hypothetical protein
MSRRLKAQTRTAEDNWQAEAPFGTNLYGALADLYGADQQQRTKSSQWCFLHVHVYVVNACAEYRRGLVMAVYHPLGARLGIRAN